MIVHTALEAARAMFHALGKGPGHWGDPRGSAPRTELVADALDGASFCTCHRRRLFFSI